MAKGCDCILVLTDWDEFKKLDFKKLKQNMKHALLFDGRNMYYDVDFKKFGIEYYGIGRGNV